MHTSRAVLLSLVSFYWLYFFSNFISNINSLWPSDAIWQHRSWSTLAQVMACCLAAPSHYLNQCWFIVSADQWPLSKGNFTRDTPAIFHENQPQFLDKISFKSLRGQWVSDPFVRNSLWRLLQSYHYTFLNDAVAIKRDHCTITGIFSNTARLPDYHSTLITRQTCSNQKAQWDFCLLMMT